MDTLGVGGETIPKECIALADFSEWALISQSGLAQGSNVYVVPVQFGCHKSSVPWWSVNVSIKQSANQGAPWSWKVKEFRKTVFQAWKVMENSKGRGKSWKMMIMSLNFYYWTVKFCKSDTTSFIKSNYDPFYLFNNGTMSRWNCYY